MGEPVNGIKKVTLEGKNGSVTLDEPEKLFSLSAGERVTLEVNEEGEGFFTANYLPVYKKPAERGFKYLYSAYGLLLRFDGQFDLPEEKIKVALSKPSDGSA